MRAARDINNDGRLTYLVSPDLFKQGTYQVFFAHTGKFSGYITDQQPIPDQPEITVEPEAITEKGSIDLNQLSLF